MSKTLKILITGAARGIELKEKALAQTKPLEGPTGRYRPPDQLLSFLQSL